MEKSGHAHFQSLFHMIKKKLGTNSVLPRVSFKIVSKIIQCVNEQQRRRGGSSMAYFV
ncbi:hypothetical protein AR1Y2_2775 [Anaerostipes rhamnosivorans]|uniref:Uncharacterized protein n=1 Tax=Anaerostipes rhamnosivorans TaxID=1229621 RepID=A0A4P8IM28_9FIRM|nr:hypothetical protein AR1Y2_2775 [Anaerostipes rhamnosivorans]